MTEKHRKYMRRYGGGLLRVLNIFNLHDLFEDHTEDFVQIPDSAIGVVIDRGMTEPAKRISILSGQKSGSFDAFVERLTKDSPATIQQYQADTELAQALTDTDLLLMPYPLWQQLRAKDPQIVDKIPTTVLLQTDNKFRK